MPTSLHRRLIDGAGGGSTARFTGHEVLRPAAGDLRDAGAVVVTLQRHLGPADSRTAARTDRRPEEAKRQAVARLHVPYRSRR